MDNFKSQYLGQTNVSFDGIPDDRGQCVQLVEFYARDVLGEALPVLPDAAAYWEQDVLGYEKVGVWTDFPKAGDIVIFDRNLQGSHGHGHICICLTSGNPGGFTSLDSNWSVPLKVTQEKHTNNNVLGSLRKKEDNMEPVPNDGDILNLLRKAHQNPNFQPPGTEFDYYKDPAHGWKELAYNVTNSMQAVIDNPPNATVLKPGTYKVE